MIVYFSGTGNSRYVARSLGSALLETLRRLPQLCGPDFRMKGESLGFVFPVYSWGVPPAVLRFVREMDEREVERLRESQTPIWAVLTCGDETGMAPQMLQKALAGRGLRLRGIWSVIMPNNYVLLPGFNVDSREVEERKLREAPERIQAIARHIRRKEWLRDYFEGSHPKLKTRAVYPLFRRWGIDPRKWHATDACVGCGRCIQVCASGNIGMRDRRPVWGPDCTSCLACFHVCPVGAVQYGRATRKKGQYNHFLKKDEDNA